MPANEADDLVGITTNIPVEVVFAAGRVPVDLNNVFVSSRDREELMDRALAAGFPQSTCVWQKGIFGAAVGEGGPPSVIGVVRGDCSGTEVLLEALEMNGVEVIPFSYPYPASREDLEREILRFCERLGTTIGEAERWRGRLERCRDSLRELDRMCWRENRVTGFENHLWLVSSSDFNGDPSAFEAGVDSLIRSARGREPLDSRPLPFKREVRLGYIGVPPVVPGIFDLVESLGARFVFHEVQRQFAMLEPADDLVDEYLRFTYPYDLAGRADDINRHARERDLDGIVHYVQSFCHRNLEDVVFSRTLGVPMLTVECDCPGELGAAARSRLESFIQVLGENL